MTPASVVAGLPGWEDAEFSALTGGLTNQAWRVTAGDKTGVLKIDEGERQAPFNSRREESRIQTNAASAGLAPKVLFADRAIYFTEYVEGQVWERDNLIEAGNLERIAATLKQVHSLPLTGRSFNASVAARSYVDKISDQNSTTVGRCIDIITSMRLPRNLCCCHNDLVAENMISTPSLMLLDWEYACDNDPLFDLATVTAHHELTPRQCDTLLDAYFDGDGRRWRSQLARQAGVYESLLYLWTAARQDAPVNPSD